MNLLCALGCRKNSNSKNVLQLSSSVSANKSSAVFAARQTKQGEQECVQCLAAGGDEEDVKGKKIDYDSAHPDNMKE